MFRVHISSVIFAPAVLSAVLLSQGCASATLPTPAPVVAHPALVTPVAMPLRSKIVRFSDSLGAVADGKIQAILAAFDYCDREQRLAFVTPPMSYSPHINYSHVSTYSLRFADESSSLTADQFIAPFECLDQKHSAKTGLAESTDVPSSALPLALRDSRGGVVALRVAADSAFESGDILVKVGKHRIETRAELGRAVDLSPVGSVAFTVIRHAKRVTVQQTILDTSASTRANALQLLGAICKDTSVVARSCQTHAPDLAQN